MKAFLEKLFKSKKQKQKEILDEITNTKVKEQATEAVIKAIKVEPKQEVDKAKKPSHFPDCNCFKCLKWKQNA